jgi:hypothetical protein
MDVPSIGTDIPVDTVLSVNGQAPAPPTPFCFSERLGDQFGFFPLLPRTNRQLSGGFRKRTLSLQRLFPMNLIVGILSSFDTECKQFFRKMF